MGWMSDRLGVRILPMRIGAWASLVVVLAILYLPMTYSIMLVLFFMLGLLTASQVISYALVAESNSSAITATAVSIVSILTQSGYILYQNIFSALMLHHGEMTMHHGIPIYSLQDYQYAAIILPLGLAGAICMLWGLRETHCRRTQG